MLPRLALACSCIDVLRIGSRASIHFEPSTILSSPCSAGSFHYEIVTFLRFHSPRTNYFSFH